MHQPTHSSLLRVGTLRFGAAITMAAIIIATVTTPHAAADSTEPPVPPSTSQASATTTPDSTNAIATPTPTDTGEAPSGPESPSTPPPPGASVLKPADPGHVMGRAGESAPKDAGESIVAPNGSPLVPGTTSRVQPMAQTLAAPAAIRPDGTSSLQLGMDVSGWQRNVDWNTARKDGSRFAFVKASEGPWTLNDYFDQQYNGAADVGMIRGAYHFARPNLSSGAQQASIFVASGGGWIGDGKTLPGVLDLEANTSDSSGNCFGLSPSQLVSWTKEFTRTYKSLTGRDAIIYTAYYFWQDCLAGSSAFSSSNPLWIAAYGAVVNNVWMPGGWPQFTFWQYASNGTFPGDQNVFNGTLAQLQTLASGPATLSMPIGATPLSGRWNGDGKTYVGWTLNGYWCLQRASAAPRCFWFGNAGDKPVVGDWNGTGTDSIGIVRNGVWQLSNSLALLRVDRTIYYGLGTDTPVTGDWDGTGRTNIGIFRNGQWNLSTSLNTYSTVSYAFFLGNPGDRPLTGDWDGNGTWGVGVARRGMYYLSHNAVNLDFVFPFGNPTDTPVAGDWDGSRTTTVGIVRNGQWQLTNSLNARQVDLIVL